MMEITSSFPLPAPAPEGRHYIPFKTSFSLLIKLFTCEIFINYLCSSCFYPQNNKAAGILWNWVMLSELMGAVLQTILQC